MSSAGVDWERRQKSAVRRLLNLLERTTMALEKPITRLVGTAEFNPLYHTGTITVFLLVVILVTGVYLTMFYQFGFSASYEAVANIEANFVGRLVRALHRYASDAAVIAALLHGWRTFFQDRFRGPRWLAWVSGVAMAAFVWAIGITGYWLIWDERAQVLNQTLIDILKGWSKGSAFVNNYLVGEAAGSGWVFILLVITVHLGLSALVGLFFWWHIKRLNRPKWLPPRHWMWVVGGLLVVAAAVVPLGMSARIDGGQIPEQVRIDLFYLFYLPAALNWDPGVFWGGVTLVLVVLGAVPWALVRKPLAPIRVETESCTGCTLCARDCPYKALEMVARSDGKHHKFVARLDPKMCVSCGVCIGSCQPLALALSEQPAEALWDETVRRVRQAGDRPVRVVFTCERHAFQGAREYLDAPAGRRPGGEDVERMEIQVVPVTCIGMVHPNLVTQALEAGAAEIQLVGCPPEDCANREGNRWMQERLERRRLPRLKVAFAKAPIRTDWLAPNDFAQAIRSQARKTRATAYDLTLSRNNWQKFLPASVLLAVVLGVQIWLSDVPFRLSATKQATVEIAMMHKSGYPIREAPAALEPEPGLETPTRLVLEVDGQVWLDKTYPLEGRVSSIYEQIRLSPGGHQLRLTMYDRADRSQVQVLYDEEVTLGNGQYVALHYVDEHIGGDPVAGEALYYETSLGTNAGCRICHSLEPGVRLVGPSFAGIATRAGERVAGMSAEMYIRQSILEPEVYIVDGFPKGQMVPNLGETLSEAQIDDLVAFLLTLK